MQDERYNEIFVYFCSYRRAIFHFQDMYESTGERVTYIAQFTISTQINRNRKQLHKRVLCASKTSTYTAVFISNTETQCRLFILGQVSLKCTACPGIGGPIRAAAILHEKIERKCRDKFFPTTLQFSKNQLRISVGYTRAYASIVVIAPRLLTREHCYYSIGCI